MRLAALISGAFLWASAAGAQEDPAGAARAAAQMLEQASVALDEAESARDRVKALTETVKAYEAGLGAMRKGLRQASLRERALTQQLSAREGEVARLLGVLQTIETSPPPLLMLHPSGPMGAARSAMMLAEVTPALNTRTQALARDLEEVRTLRQLQHNAAETLQDGLAGVQQARAELSKAIADRTDLPRRFTADPVRTAILIDSTETLAGFADGLSLIGTGEIGDTAMSIASRKGQLPWPVQGVLLHRAGQADAAGISREGVILATRPRALVTSPAPATIRYRGPLLDLGNVVILEPQQDVLFVLSGLAEVFGEAGQVIPEGAPVGLMGGQTPEIGAILSTSGEGTGTDRSETLYIEVREGGSPVDPATWFRTEMDG
ncbi:Septal ring factor EnvC, activator of murein hydrolases AmiA and AmiB [Cribrihabitans marinus]|uniref:Septal ring factor EnvC, activator of murein hydrolases AmiA and AmiB n=1 Tax=Cribrihabitans marinus TaxID=1227549 RepID=A0A1H6ZB18_9RHOB|nr:peptidoglycan DD-metalloendopeptidase family protein [Cribrihabitans marinus]GGH31000.1 peptidase M23 [Cribrihabitans marinus]SEJ50743.1 Septal ring factor EnvC, activator of murein hydrolases AmiA and AmiB [Cribrihabitans marinus]